MIKSNKQVIIDFIISCLKVGEDRKKILAKIGKKWQISERTLDRYLKISNQQHTEEQQVIKDKLAEVAQQAAIDTHKKAILTADERKELLTKIAKGEIEIPLIEKRWNGKTKKFATLSFKGLPPHTARISAISELNKMEGDYAPIKQQFEVFKTLPDFSNLSIDQIKELLDQYP